MGIRDERISVLATSVQQRERLKVFLASKGERMLHEGNTLTEYLGRGHFTYQYIDDEGLWKRTLSISTCSIDEFIEKYSGETEKPEKFPEKYQDAEDWYVPAWYYRMVTDTMAGHPDDDIRLNAYRVGYENGVDIRWTLKDKLNLKLHENRALAQAVGEYGVTHCLLEMIDEQSAPIQNETVRLYAVSSTPDGTFVFLVTPNDDHGMEWTSTYEFPEGFVFPQEVLDHME